ncbi:hypothetical protein FX016_21785 [Cupriavidus gilardii]|nr:hypothetical protein FX016_21785 [Cupriavidus gilardii]
MNKRVLTISGEGIEAFMIHPFIFPRGFTCKSFADRPGWTFDDPSAFEPGHNFVRLILCDPGHSEAPREDVHNMLAVFRSHMPMPPRSGAKDRVSMYVLYPDGRVLGLADGAFLIENGDEEVLGDSDVTLNMQFNAARLHQSDSVYKLLASKPFDPDEEYFETLRDLSRRLPVEEAKHLAGEVIKQGRKVGQYY